MTGPTTGQVPAQVAATESPVRPVQLVPAANGVIRPGAGLGDRRLVALVASHGEPVVLVWHRHRRGTSYEALVHPDGVIELADGTRVTDPSAAAEIASGSQAPVDGWRVWRVGSQDGPALADAVASRF